ncbi:MAG: NapC/NirT family cytochrome c [bacterium]
MRMIAEHLVLLGGWLVTIGLSIYLLMFVDRLAEERAGRILLLVGLTVLPIGSLIVSVRHGLHESTRTAFCRDSCHEMAPFAKTLTIDDEEVVPAVHFQNNLLTRDHACYTCHADYSMFGDVKAKLGGLRHIYRHYLGGVPDKIQLYEPFPNDNCLWCHRGSRRFEASKQHRTAAAPLAKILTGEVSCMQSDCHDLIHPVDDLDSYEFWEPKKAAPAMPSPTAVLGFAAGAGSEHP